MEILTLDKKEYSELTRIKDIIEKILNSAKARKTVKLKEDGFSKAFGVLKNDIKGNSLDYICKLRKEWRN